VGDVSDGRGESLPEIVVASSAESVDVETVLEIEPVENSLVVDEADAGLL
jgi:hypothetical protein